MLHAYIHTLNGFRLEVCILLPTRAAKWKQNNSACNSLKSQSPNAKVCVLCHQINETISCCIEIYKYIIFCLFIYTGFVMMGVSVSSVDTTGAALVAEYVTSYFHRIFVIITDTLDQLIVFIMLCINRGDYRLAITISRFRGHIHFLDAVIHFVWKNLRAWNFHEGLVTWDIGTWYYFNYINVVNPHLAIAFIIRERSKLCCKILW